jgi:hypothetical protein
MKVNRRFGGIYRLHLQFRRIREARNQRETGGKQSLRSGKDVTDTEEYGADVVCFDPRQAV